MKTTTSSTTTSTAAATRSTDHLVQAAPAMPVPSQPDISDTLDSALTLSDRVSVVLDHISSAYFLSDTPNPAQLSHDYHRIQTFLDIASDYSSQLDSAIRNVG